MLSPQQRTVRRGSSVGTRRDEASAARDLPAETAKTTAATRPTIKKRCPAFEKKWQVGKRQSLKKDKGMQSPFKNGGIGHPHLLDLIVQMSFRQRLFRNHPTAPFLSAECKARAEPLSIPSSKSASQRVTMFPDAKRRLEMRLKITWGSIVYVESTFLTTSP